MAKSRSKRSPGKTRNQPRRDYRSEYDNYQGRPEQIKRRVRRNAARRLYEKRHGNLPTQVDVDHIKPIVKGGGNAPSNLRRLGRTRNRSFRRTKTAHMRG